MDASSSHLLALGEHALRHLEGDDARRSSSRRTRTGLSAAPGAAPTGSASPSPRRCGAAALRRTGPELAARRTAGRRRGGARVARGGESFRRRRARRRSADVCRGAGSARATSSGSPPPGSRSARRASRSSARGRSRRAAVHRRARARSRRTACAATSDVTPEVEEVVGDPDRADAEHPLPDRRQPSLERRARRDDLAHPSERSPRRRGQRLAVDLAVRSQWERVEALTIALGTMYAGRCSAELAAKLARRRPGRQTGRCRRPARRRSRRRERRRPRAPRPGCGRAASRSRPARCGSRAPSPGGRAGRGTRRSRRGGSGRGRPSGRSGPGREGVRQEALRRQVGRSRYPRATPSPPIYSSPATPAGSGWRRESRM